MKVTDRAQPDRNTHRRQAVGARARPSRQRIERYLAVSVHRNKIFAPHSPWGGFLSFAVNVPVANDLPARHRHPANPVTSPTTSNNTTKTVTSPRKRRGPVPKTIRPELESLARLLRNARTNMGLTQDEVAEKLEVTAQTIRNWEVKRTEPSATHKEALFRIYGIQTTELVDLKNRKGLTAVAPFTRVVADPERLKMVRQRSGLQQRQAANQSGMSPETLGRYERGVATPSKAKLESSATTYGVSPEWFIHRSSIQLQDETGSTGDSRPTRPGLRSDKVTDAYRLAQPDLFDDDINSFADFTPFLRDRQLDQHR